MSYVSRTTRQIQNLKHDNEQLRAELTRANERRIAWEGKAATHAKVVQEFRETCEAKGAENARLREEHQPGCEWIDGVGEVECTPACTVDLRAENESLTAQVDEYHRNKGCCPDPVVGYECRAINAEREESKRLRAENARLKRHAAEHGRQIREMAASVKRDEKLWARLDELAGKVLEAT